MYENTMAKKKISPAISRLLITIGDCEVTHVPKLKFQWEKIHQKTLMIILDLLSLEKHRSRKEIIHVEVSSLSLWLCGWRASRRRLLCVDSIPLLHRLTAVSFGLIVSSPMMTHWLLSFWCTVESGGPEGNPIGSLENGRHVLPWWYLMHG